MCSLLIVVRCYAGMRCEMLNICQYTQTTAMAKINGPCQNIFRYSPRDLSLQVPLNRGRPQRQLLVYKGLSCGINIYMISRRQTQVNIFKKQLKTHFF